MKYTDKLNLINGLILGNGKILNKKLFFRCKESYKEYLDFIQMTLNVKSIKSYVDQKTKKRYYYFYQEVDFLKKKLNFEILSHWYCHRGFNYPKNNYCLIELNKNFDLEIIKQIEDLGISISLNKNKNKKRIRISSKSHNYFINKIYQDFDCFKNKFEIKNHKIKLQKKDFEEIIRLYEHEHKTQQFIADLFGVSQSTINNIINKNYKVIKACGEAIVKKGYNYIGKRE